jgi:hypothetical protein
MTFTFKLERLDGTPADPPSFKKDRAWQNGELDEAERTSRGPSSETSSSALPGRTRTTRGSAWASYAGRGSWCRAQAWWVGRPSEAASVFSLNIEQATFISWDTEHGEMTIRRWSPQLGYTEAGRSYP